MPGRNILLLIADDLGRHALGCYGDKHVKTPSLDELAAQGTVFDMAFTSTASCSGSRSVIFTGLHTHENGTYGLQHDYHHFQTFSHIDTAPKLFDSLGHDTAIIGKIHVGPEAVYPWRVRKEYMGRDVSVLARETSNYLAHERDPSKPFFLTVAFCDPHRDDSRGGFGNDECGACEGAVEHTDYTPDMVSVPNYLNDIPAVREELTEYYKSITRMDHGVRLVLNALKQHGLEQDTLVIFVSDNGAPFINSKTTLYDAGVHLPMIVRRPGQTPGVRNPNLVSFIDILPTLLDWSGHADVRGARKGRSVLPILESSGRHGEWTRVFGSHTLHEITNYYPTRFVRTARFKYHRNIAWKLDFPFSADIYSSLSWEAIRNSALPIKIGQRMLQAYLQRPPETLHDLEADPDEVHNLVHDPNYHDVLSELRLQMEAWQRDTNDPWLIRDGVSVRAIAKHLDAGMDIPHRLDFDIESPGTK